MIERIQAALSYISPEERDIWVSMGMAVKSELGPSGYDCWAAWAMQSDSFSEASSKAVWKSIKMGGGTTVGSLFHLAELNGWADDGKRHIETPQQYASRIKAREDALTTEGIKIADEHARAARKAAWIIKNSVLEQHAYLDSKGYSDAKGLVWRKDAHTNFLVIPMRIGRDIAGVQLIDRDGVKKFLAGQKTAGAEYAIDAKGIDIFVEGFCTGLSVRACMQALKIKYHIHICFSAHNMEKMAKAAGRGICIIDHDESGTGQRAGAATGLPCFLPPVLGQDFNDMHRAVGLFAASQALKKWLTLAKV